MWKLLKTEWLKIYRYPAFWLLLAICLITYPGINYICYNIYLDITQRQSMTGQIVSLLLGNPFSFPEVWQTSAYLSSMFVIIPALLIIMLISNEYVYRTSRQNIIDGWSRYDFLLAKAIDVALITFIVTILYAIVALVVGIVHTDSQPAVDPAIPLPDMNSTEGSGSSGSIYFEKIHYIGLFALQTFSQLSLAFLLGMLVRKAFVAMGIFLFYALIAEPLSVGLLKYKFNNDIGKYFPMEVSDRIVPPPAFMSKLDEAGYQASLDAVPMHVGLTIVLIGITWMLTTIIYKKRDL
ncbi:MAG TPA: hypothetical protein VIK80_08040 [Flavihumibacter sp.]|jgi:ABC-2 type transport system permease protein